MPSSLKKTPKMGKRKSKLIVRLLLPMMLVVCLQLAIFFGILIMGGEFSYVEQYAYNTLIEKTGNRRNYIQDEFQQKMPHVQESAEKVNALVANLLAESGASITEMQTDRALNRLVLESSVDILVELLRRSTVNDVYLILDTGSLYSEDGGGSNAKAALYLRDLDTNTDAGFQDLLMEMGFTSIAQKYGIVLDSGWSLHFESDPEDTKQYDYYYRTVQTARENSELSLEDLGYWSSFSKINRSGAESMKYSIPLIAENGTVYGVLGIGLTENSILTSLPANDFTSETACYVLGRNQSNGAYDIITHSGDAYSLLVGNTETLRLGSELKEGVYDFLTAGDINLAGSTQPIELYESTSPYFEEQWALISVADRASVLSPLTNLLNMLSSAAVISVVVSMIVVGLSGRQVVKPISDAIKTMNSNKDYNHVIRFKSTNIYEFDQMTDAITQLQINVQDFSSQVSQMIRIANVGLGTFMYDRTNDTVFVGQSLLKQLGLKIDQDEDVMMERRDFLNSIIAPETQQAVSDALNILPSDASSDYSKEFSITQEDGTTNWMRLSLVHTANKSIGILQDITSVIMEKKRIEYERDYDSTTGLLNRRAYGQRLAELFHNKSELKTTAIIMLDLDNLKYVNDTYGHDFGDDYIKTAATMLKKFQAYGGIVSRLSGDEFNVCLPGFSSKEEVREIIAEVRGQLLQSSCLLADGTHFKIRASAGVAWYPDDAKSYEQLMKYADFAMYTIKHSKKGEIAEFDMSAYSSDSVLLTGVEEVNRIIDERSVRYAFQPILSAKTGHVYGYEALMRPLSNIFQSHLELLRTAKTGAKLYDLERLTWTKALEDFQTQINQGNIAPDSRIFINSIATCALDSGDMDVIEAAHPNLLSQVVLEILESENTNQAYLARKMKRVKSWNAQVALDDFGISYNSETVLSELQPNVIKIDRSIVSGCDKDISRRTIIANLVKLARTKQILVLAGGVETEDEMKAVISCGVDLLQGYYLNRPLFEPQPIDPEIIATLKHLSNADSDPEII